MLRPLTERIERPSTDITPVLTSVRNRADCRWRRPTDHDVNYGSCRARHSADLARHRHTIRAVLSKIRHGQFLWPVQMGVRCCPRKSAGLSYGESEDAARLARGG